MAGWLVKALGSIEIISQKSFDAIAPHFDFSIGSAQVFSADDSVTKIRQAYGKSNVTLDRGTVRMYGD